MSLKSSIVVVNQYTLLTPSGGTGPATGSMGSTPGAYVTRYMARDLACEQIAPIRRGDLDGFVTNYMARSDAVEALLQDYRQGAASVPGAPVTSGYDAPTLKGRRLQRTAKRAMARARKALGLEPRGAVELKREFARQQGDGGVAFGHSGVSLSHEKLHADAAGVQELFDAGHTVLKTVLSFDHDYLVRHGLVPEDMSVDPGTGEVARGAYRGQLDQLKLRLAVMEGLAKMSREAGFDDLRYVGVIQVDTSHVHAHLAIVDAGKGRLARDGTQKGKLSAREMGLMRRGIDATLDRHARVAHLSSSVGYQRRSVSAYVRRWAYESLSVSARAQFALACLPEDRTLWRASSNSTEMARPNRLVRQMVEEHLAAPGSPMDEAMVAVQTYADGRRDNEGLDRRAHQRLIDDGRERIVLQAMNGVYSVLAAVADDELTVSTPVMKAMAADMDELMELVGADAGDQGTGDRGTGADGQEQGLSLSRFALRLRSYSERLERHRTHQQDYLLRARSWQDAAAAGVAAPGSEAMHTFYLTEADYHGRCVSKYQHYLDTGGGLGTQWAQQWQSVEAYGRALTGLRALRGDRSIPKMGDPQAAEACGREIYGQPGGRLLAASGAEGRAGRAVLDARIADMAATYRRLTDELVRTWESETVALRIRAAEPGTEPEPGEQVISAGGDLEPGAVPGLDVPGSAVLVAAEPEHPFEEVKGLDMHELALDWDTDQKVGRRTAGRFARTARDRYDAAQAARKWMVATGQSADVDGEVGPALADITLMSETAAAIRRSGSLRSRFAEAARAAAQRRRARRAELEEIAATEAAQAAADVAAEAGAEDRVQADLEAEIIEQAAGRAPKPRGRTTRIDSGLGGAISASMDRVVRQFRPGSELGG